MCRIVTRLALSAVLLSLSAANYAAYTPLKTPPLLQIEQVGQQHVVNEDILAQARAALRQRDFQKASELIEQITHNDAQQNLHILGQLLQEQHQVNSTIRDVFDWYR